MQAVGIMKEGQIFTIEPMVNAGTYRDITWPGRVDCSHSGWQAVCAV